MTSARKAEANKRNGRMGRGPRTLAGKRRSSHNALRHGFAATIHRAPLPQSRIEHFARTLCGDHHDPLLFEQALMIAENHMLLGLIEAQQLTVVERLWDPTETALVKGDNRRRLMRARVRKKQTAEKLLVPLRDALLEKYKDVLGENILSRDGLIPLHLEAYLEEKASELESEALKQPDVRFHSESCMKPRDDSAAMQDAARDLIRLERYQRQAWSRLKKAIRGFINIKLNALVTHVPETISAAFYRADNLH
jgi:hypothetical protein